MGAVGSAQLHKRSTRDSVSSQVDSVVPSSSNSAALRPESSRKCRFAALIRNKYAECKLSRLQSRRKNRPAISRDTQRAFRELISSWSCSELAAFCTEMDSAYAVRELVLMAEAARPPVSSLQQDLFNAFSSSIATDCFVLYRDGRYAAHEAILCARSRYFAEQFASVHHDVNECMSASTGIAANRELKFIDETVPYEIFLAALQFIYTGQTSPSLLQEPQKKYRLNDVLSRLGCTKALIDDLSTFDFAKNADCTLVFTTNTATSTSYDEKDGMRRSDALDYRIGCASGIVAARSDFLRTLIERKRQSRRPEDGEEQRECAHWPLEIVIDEHLIPRIYAPVVLHAIYTDRLDLSKVLDGCQVSASSLNEVQAIASGRRQKTPLRHAIDVYHIAQFLNLHQLAQSCEDVMVDELSLDTVNSLWEWASDAGGSAFVRRACVAYLRNEFSRLCGTNGLLELNEQLLNDCLVSDYVQCSEVEILESVVRWGEHELVRRMEEREPNLVANTTHSISRRGVRRSELDDVELRNILGDLLPLVRIDYILPPFHQSLNSAYKRGLLDRAPNSDLLGQRYPDSRSPDVNPDAHWFDHGVPRRHPAGPRLLLPYISETHNQLRRMCGNGADVLADYRRGVMGEQEHRTRFVSNGLWGHVVNLTPEVLSEAMRTLVEKRINETLRSDNLVRKAFCCGCAHHRHMAIEQVRLRILRELGLNDSCMEIILPVAASSTQTGGVRDSYVPRHYSSQPALTVMSVWPDLMRTVYPSASRPESPHSEYDNESLRDFRPDLLRTESMI